MKKLSVIFTFLLLATLTKAQQTISPATNQVWWGYFSENDFGYKDAMLSRGRVRPLMACIRIPANNQLLKSATIKAVRVYLSAKTVEPLSDMKIWISRSLPDKVSDADYVQDITTPLTTNANDFELTTPYVIGDTEFYIGYYVKSTVSSFIRIAGLPTSDALYIGNPEAEMSWVDTASSGKLPFQLLLEGGGFKDYDASPHDFKPTYVSPGQSVGIPIEITNNGRVTIHDFSYTITVNGITSAEQNISCTDIPYNYTGQVTIPFQGQDAEGINVYTLTVTKLNGQPNTSTGNKAKGKITTVENVQSWPRRMLLEEFTTERCVNCPEVATMLSEFTQSYPNLASRMSIVCHHSGYSTDWLTVSASSSYEWFYNNYGTTYAPALMYDRYSWTKTTPVEHRKNSAEEYQSPVNSRLSVPSYANIQLSATFSSNKRNIIVTANCERSWDFCSTPSRITLFLTEDNINARSQSGADGSFVHQHVLRDVNETWGTPLTWNNNKASYSHTFSLGWTWKTDNLKVIAFISGYNANDPTDCTIENVAEVNMGGSPTAVSTISDRHDTIAECYTIDGRKISTPQRGLNIIRTAEGKTVKVMVR